MYQHAFIGKEKVGFSKCYHAEWDEDLGDDAAQLILNIDIRSTSIPGEEVAAELFDVFKNNFLNFKIINQVIFIIIIILGVYYLSGTNDLAVKGFKLSELKDQQSQLAKENQDLELKVMSLDSYNNITSRVRGLRMVAANEIDYLAVGAATVAKK